MRSHTDQNNNSQVNPVSVVKLGNIDPLFLEQGAAISMAGSAGQSDLAQPPSSTSTLLSPTATEKPSSNADRRAVIISDYPRAFSDTYGTISESPFLYKTGGPWPQREDGPDAQPFLRQLHPVNSHPIVSAWTSILGNVEKYLDKHKVPFTAVAGFAWGNQGAGEPFCPLLMTIGVKLDSVVFAIAEATSHAVKTTILDKLGFPEVEVAIWEWMTGFAIGPKLSSLNPLVDGVVSEFAAPFSSVLPLAIAPLSGPNYEGTGGMYLRRKTGSKGPLVLTAGHVTRPPLMHANNTGLTETASCEHHEEIIVLGDRGFGAAITRIESRIGSLQEIKARAEDSIRRLQEQEATSTGKFDRIAKALRREEQEVANATEDIMELNDLHTRVAETMLTTTKRSIGRVLHADPIGPSSGLTPFTIDWAVIELSEDAFDWNTFQGNKTYIGGKIDKNSFRDLMYPWAPDRAGYDATAGTSAMPVIKNGLTTGTTMGWLNGLETLVRHYEPYNITFDSLETTILPYGGGRGAFSAPGDSGAIILDRQGRIVALLTGGAGLTNETDVTFATAWYLLEPHIKDTLEGIDLF